MTPDEILEKVKLILGINDSAQDPLLEYAIELVQERVLHYINHKTMPEGLEKIIPLMVASYYKTSGFGTQAADPGTVTSVKRGDVSTSFAATNKTGSAAMFDLGGGDDGFFGWRSVLNEYRRVRWCP